MTGLGVIFYTEFQNIVSLKNQIAQSITNDLFVFRFFRYRIPYKQLFILKLFGSFICDSRTNKIKNY